MPDRPTPDPLAAAAEWLLTQKAVTDLVDTRVSDRTAAAMPCLRLALVSTPVSHAEETHARIQVDCFGQTQGQARELAAVVTAAATGGTARGDWAGGWCAGASVLSGPRENPDDATDTPRAQLDIGLWLYPL